jgi:hypothetical protein
MSRIKLGNVKKTKEVPIRRTVSLTVEQWFYVLHTLEDYRSICRDEYFSECQNPKQLAKSAIIKATRLIRQISEHLIEEDKKDGL